MERKVFLVKKMLVEIRLFFIKIYFGNIKIPLYLQPHLMRGGALAQLVEQWTENPCVPGSIPGGTT